MGPSENRFSLEINGANAVSALEATPPKKVHTLHEYQPGNQPYPEIGRGSYKCEEMTFKHAHGVGDTLQELVRMAEDYFSGVNVDKFGCRFVVWDEGGLIPITVYECYGCVFTSFGADPHTGTGTGTSTFSFSIRPTDFRVL